MWRPSRRAQGQQLVRRGVETSGVEAVPLELPGPSDPSEWKTVVGGFDFHAAVEMDEAFAELVIAERLGRSGFRARFSSVTMAATGRLVVQ